jgi:hypothetical protein
MSLRIMLCSVAVFWQQVLVSTRPLLFSRW